METDQSFGDDSGSSAPDPSPSSFTSPSQPLFPDRDPFPSDPSPRTRRSSMVVSGPVGIAAAAVGLLLFLVAFGVIRSHSNDVSTPGFQEPPRISWVENGDEITAGDYSEVGDHSTEASVRERFGKPADMTGAGEGCIGYRSKENFSLYIFCFDESGRFVEKKTF